MLIKARSRAAKSGSTRKVVGLACGAVGLVLVGLVAFYGSPRGAAEAFDLLEDPVAEIEGPASLQRYEIRIPPLDYQRLVKTRDQAVANRTLYGIENPFLKADLIHGGESTPIRIRLKGGGAVDHVGGDKWSFRVEARGQAVAGMEAFSLMDPKRRGYAMEWLLRQVLRREGVIGKRYRFVELVLNGTRQGIYAVDEHYTGAMLTANERREGPILRLSQDQLWGEGAAFELNRSDLRTDYFFGAALSAVGQSKLERNPEAKPALDQARALYTGFRQGTLRAHDVFDRTFATWLALGDLLGAWHGFGTFNMKFYYNPTSGRLEPVPDDAFNESTLAPPFRYLRLDDPVIKGRFLTQVFSDTEFVALYLSELERISRAGYMREVVDSLSEEIQEQERILNVDYPGYRVPLEQLFENESLLRETLRPHAGLVAYLRPASAGELVLHCAAIKSMPVEVLGVEDALGARWEPGEGAVVPGKPSGTPLALHEVTLKASGPRSEPPPSTGLTVHYRLLGTTQARTAPVSAWDPALDPIEDDVLRAAPNVNEFSFLKREPVSGELQIQPGSWVVDKPLIVPAGTVLSAGPGTTLDLKAGGFVLSRSPLRFVGSPDQAVVVTSSDGTGQGVAVFEADGPSRLEHVQLSNLAPPQRGKWALSGAVTFYRSSVTLLRCSVVDMRAEDALNLIRCGFRLEGVELRGSQSDGLDVDFGKGEISESRFLDSGNDALDVSGSEVAVRRTSIERAADKGISVGEASHVELSGVSASGCRIGVAVKDLSHALARDVKLADCEIGFAVFQKKPSFGPSRVRAEGCGLTQVKQGRLVEVGSTLAWNGVEDVGRETHVATQLYPPK